MKTLKSTFPWHKLPSLPRALLAYFLIGCVGILFFIPCFLLLFLPERYRRDNPVLFWFLHKTLSGIVWASLVSVKFHGRHHIPHGSAIFAANHESAFDIPLLGSLAGNHPQVWFALDFYLKFPVLGFFIRRLGIPVARGDTPRAARALVTAIRLLENNGRHLMIFPEGGRFVDGTVHQFYQGFSYIAIRTRRPVIPVYMHNVGSVFPPDNFLPDYRFKVFVEIGEPFIAREGETEAEFSQRVHAWFVVMKEKYTHQYGRGLA